MTNEFVKKLTGKNPKDFEFAASHIVNNSDAEAFSELVKQDDFLFDFIKQNVSKRLSGVCNVFNFKKIVPFLKIYSPSYEEFIVSTLVKFADEDLTDEMLELLENGSDEEKAYAARYFAQINDSLAIDLLRKNSYSDFEPLALNCAIALSEMKDEFSYNNALEKLQSDDEFEKLSAVHFLVAYNNLEAVDSLFKTMKRSSMPENIASEISYLQSFLDFLDTDFKYDTILAVNHIVNGLGEIISLAQIFDFQLFEVFEKLVEIQKQLKDSKIAVVLLNAQLKFEQLTENEEYIFDEDKNTKAEVYNIKAFLNSQDKAFWVLQKQLFQNELTEISDFIFSALELVQDLQSNESIDGLKNLLNSQNQTKGQTIILKTIEVIKSINKLTEIDQNKVLEKISDENIRLIIQSLFK